MTLDEFIQHPLYPFLKFRTDDAEFLLPELFWTQLAREALGEELAATAVPLMEADQADGNPILLSRLSHITRAVRVVLTRNEYSLSMPRDVTPENPFTYYRPVQFAGDTSPMSFDGSSTQDNDALLISCDMNLPEVCPIVMAMIRDFCVDQLDPAEVDARADAYCMRLGYPDPRDAAAYWAAHPLFDDDDV